MINERQFCTNEQNAHVSTGEAALMSASIGVLVPERTF